LKPKAPTCCSRFKSEQVHKEQLQNNFNLELPFSIFAKQKNKRKEELTSANVGEKGIQRHIPQSSILPSFNSIRG